MDENGTTASTLKMPDRCSGDEAARQRAFEQCGIPRRHRLREVTPEGEWAERFEQLKDLLGTGLTYALVGNRGAGKTQMACELVRFAIWRAPIAQNAYTGRTVLQFQPLYARAMDIFLRIRATYHRDSEKTEDTVLFNLRQPSLLVIDEFQERSESAWEQRLLTNLIDKRYGDMTDTLLISNLDPQSLVDSLGSSIVDRMHEVGGIINCNWPSFRRKK